MTKPVPSHAKPSPLLWPTMGLLILTAPWAHAQSDRPPLDAATALADLTRLEEANQRATEERRKEAVSTLRQAAGSPGSAGRLYEEAIAGAGQADMSDWKKKNADLLRDKNFQEAVQMHLRYLLLSLERGSSEDPARWAEPSMQYARDLARLLTDKDVGRAPGQARELLAKPVADGPFARWLRLAPLLPVAAVWEQVPGNLAGILEKNVRAPWRATGDARLDVAWQLELETGVALANADGSDRAAEDFNSRTAPSLQFRRARDRAAAGQPNRAAEDILAIARKNPDHPDFPQWAGALREMLGPKTPTPPTPAP